MSDKHYEPKDGTGALFKNTKKEKPAQPDYTGDLKVEGVAFKLAAWIKSSKSGLKYMALSAIPKEGEGRPTSSKSNELNDDIGF